MSGSVLLVLAAALLGPTSARAAVAVNMAEASVEAPSTDSMPALVVVRWTAPRGCPSHEQVIRRLDEFVAPRGGAARAVETHARVKFLGPRRWRLELTLHTEQGTSERTLDAESCRAAADATALVTAIAAAPYLPNVDREVVPATDPASPGRSDAAAGSQTERSNAEQVPASGEPSSTRKRAGGREDKEEPGDKLERGDTDDDESQTTTTREIDSAVRTPRRAGHRLSTPEGRLQAHGGATIGLSNVQLSAAVGGGVELAWPRFSVGGGAIYVPPYTVAQDEPTARLRVLAGVVQLGPVFRRGRVRVPLSVGAEAGYAYGQAIGLTDPVAEQRLPWMFATGQVAVDVGLGARFSVGAALQLRAALVRTQFEYGIHESGASVDVVPRETLWRTPNSGARLTLGVSVRLW